VFLSASIRVSDAVSNLVLRADNFFYSYTVLDELEERNAGSISGYRTSSLEEF
jgi:hypothetical protein